MSADIYNQETEEALIGALLQEPANLPNIAFIRDTDFFFVRYRLIWQAIVDTAKQCNHYDFDYISVIETLTAQNNLATIGGHAEVMRLYNETPDAYHVGIYAVLVKKTAQRRQLIEAMEGAIRQAADTSVPLAAVTRDLDEKLTDLDTQASLDNEMVAVGDEVSSLMDYLDDGMQGEIKTGIPSVIPELNYIIDGYMGGRLYLVGGRPGMGKTSMLCSEAVHMMQSGRRVLFFSLEMSKRQLTSCFVSIYTHIPNKKLDTARIDQGDWSKFCNAVNVMHKWPLLLSDKSVTPAQLRGICRREHKRQKVDAIFLDYIQLMDTGSEVSGDNRYQEVGYISRILKNLSLELDVPVIAAAQLSRNPEQRNDKRPQLADLRESGNLEADADLVLFPFNEGYYSGTKLPVQGVEVIVAKNRFGETGQVNCAFLGAFKQFAGLARPEGNNSLT